MRVSNNGSINASPPTGWWSVITILSLILPGIIFYWMVSAAISGTPLRQVSNRIPLYSKGWMRHDEFWFPAIQLSDEWWAGPGTPSTRGTSIRCLDLSTGIDHDTGLEIPDFNLRLAWIKDELYAISDTALYKREGTSFRELAKLPLEAWAINSHPFLYDGQLTLVVFATRPTTNRSSESEFQMVHLANGKWIDGAKLILPGSNRLWKHDPAQDCMALVTRRARDWSSDTSGTGPLAMLTVIADQNDRFHLFYQDHFYFSGYRQGFEFVRNGDESDSASATVPENAPPDVSGWEQIRPVKSKDRWQIMGQQGDCLIFGGFSTISNSKLQFRSVCRNLDGTWDEINGLDSMLLADRNSSLIRDDSGGGITLVRENRWNAVDFCRILADGSPPVHLSIPGDAKGYLERWMQLLWCFGAAWLLHVGLIVGGACVLNASASTSDYQFGDQHVLLSSFVRRGFAFAIDLTLFGVVLYTASWCVIWYRQPTFLDSGDAGLAATLHQLANAGFMHGARGMSAVVASTLSLLSVLLFGQIEPEDLVQVLHLLNGVLVDVSIVLIVVRHLVEGRTGITPGKWLLGIRTMRSTLRPCGFARALLRNLMLWCDLPLFLSPWPAVTSLLFSPTRQRLGDRLADTIVVQASSLSRKTGNA